MQYVSCPNWYGDMIVFKTISEELDKYKAVYTDRISMVLDEEHEREMIIYAFDVEEAVEEFKERSGKGLDGLVELQKYSEEMADTAFNIINKNVSLDRKKWIIKRQKNLDKAMDVINKNGYVETEIGYLVSSDAIIVGDKIFRATKTGYYDLVDWVYRLTNPDRCKTPPMRELREHEYERLANSQEFLNIVAKFNPSLAVTMGLMYD